jgi:signal transduction histidine kinase
VLRATLERLNAWPIRQRAALLEAAVYFALVWLWVLLVPADYPGRFILGGMIVAAPAAAGALQVLFSFNSLPKARREAWLYLGLALAGWAVRHFLWIFLGPRGQDDPSLFSLSDLFGLLAYPFAALGLVRLSTGFRHAPARFRFLLDLIVNSGVAVTLGWLLLGRAFPVGPQQVVPTLYPIADIVLLMVIVNLALAGSVARSTAYVLGLSLIFMALSDYANSLLSLYRSDPAGTFLSLGWVLAYLLMGNEVIRERQRVETLDQGLRSSLLDLSTQIQNILPVTLVLALAWYVLADWRLRGELSAFGVVMSLVFVAILIVRLGIRAGEVELQRYWQLFSSLGEPAFICDEQGRILLGNPAFSHLYEEGDDDSNIPNLLSIFAAPALNIHTLTRASHAVVSDEVTLAGEQQTPYLLTLSSVAAEGRRRLIAGVAHDLSEQKQQQDALRQAFGELQTVHRQLEDLNAELEARVEERTRTLQDAYNQLEDQNKKLQELDLLKTDFVSMVSHELRTPLNNLGGGLELMLGRGRASIADQETMQLMQAEIHRLTRFVENILNLSALDAGRLDLHPVPLSLAVAVEEVLRKRSLGQDLGRIVTEVPPDLPLVWVDEAAVQSVFHHLLDNALKYAAEGPVIIRSRLVDDGVRVEVLDSGPGIPPEKRHLLFQRFQRLDARDSQSVYGYGLGLYLSRRLMTAMKSDLCYEAPKAGGSCFYFTLKVAE